MARLGRGGDKKCSSEAVTLELKEIRAFQMEGIAGTKALRQA